MPVDIPFTTERAYTCHEIDNKLAGTISAAIGMSGSRSKTDSFEIRYRGVLPTTGYLLRDPVYNSPWWYPAPFECLVDAIAVRILARKADKSGIVQNGLLFNLASPAQSTWEAGDSLVVKLGMYAGGEMKIELGTEAEFVGGTNDEWKSRGVILTPDLITEFTNGTLHIDCIGRIVFRFAV